MPVFFVPLAILLHSRAMKPTIYKCLLAAFCLVLPAVLWAQAAEDLYSGQVLVADESPQARAEGLRQILRQVLERLSGRDSVTRGGAAEAVLARAASLVQQFRYLAPPERQGEEPGGRLLWARFDPEALERLLREQGVPVWDGKRPRVLLWLAEEQGAQRRLLDPAEDAPLREALRREAARFGTPVQFPLMDLQDQSTLTAADLWADYAAAIRDASRRYPHDLVLTGRLRAFADGQWGADWSLWDGAAVEHFETRGEDRATALRAGIDALQERLLARHQPQMEGAGEEVLVRIEDVDGLRAYGELMRWLATEPGLQGVQLREADGSALVLGLRAAAQETLLRQLDAAPLLEALPGSETEVEDPGRHLAPGLAVVRSYRFIGGR